MAEDKKEKSFGFTCDCGIEHLFSRGEKGDVIHKITAIPKKKEEDEDEDKKPEKKGGLFDELFAPFKFGD